MTDLVLTEHHDGGVALLRLNRPPMNPLSIAMLGELRDAATASAAIPRSRPSWSRGARRRWRPGADITELRDQRGARRVDRRVPRRVRRGRRDPAAGDRRHPRLRVGGRLRARAHVRPARGRREHACRPTRDPPGALPGAGGTQRLARGSSGRRARKELIWSGPPGTRRRSARGRNPRSRRARATRSSRPRCTGPPSWGRARSSRWAWPSV